MPEEGPGIPEPETPETTPEAEAASTKDLTEAPPEAERLPSELALESQRVGWREWFHTHKAASLLAIFLGVSVPAWVVHKAHDWWRQKKEQEAAAKEAQERVEAAPVNVTEVKLGRFQDTLTALGTIAGGSEIEMRFQVDGIIDKFNFKEGDKVRKGDVIAQLSPREARLKLEKARLELDQYEKLYALGGVSKNRLEEARLAMDLAQSEFEKTILSAPRGGVIGDKSAEIGEFVTPARKIVTLVSIETVVVKVGIIEKNIDKVYPGQSVLITVDTYPGTIFEGKVDNISPLIQGTSKTLTVEARIKNDGGLLLPGMFARTKIVTHEADNPVIVPRDCIIRTSGGLQVFVVKKDDRAILRDVEVGYTSASNEFAEVVKGLSPGELLVIQKPDDLRDGSPVKVVEVQQ